MHYNSNSKDLHRCTGHEILGGADVSLPDSRPGRVS